MPSLKENFEELLERIRQGRSLDHASFEPVYYLIFPPKQILEVKRTLPAWIARLHNDGWNVRCFSIAEHMSAIFQGVPQRKIWLAADRKSPLSWQKTNQSLANVIEQGALRERLQAFLQEVNDTPNAIVLITDLEALHPYMRIGVIEGELTGEFKHPTIILYPGERTGKTRLKFLGFYREDGNYRSVHVGG